MTRLGAGGYSRGYPCHEVLTSHLLLRQAGEDEADRLRAALGAAAVTEDDDAPRVVDVTNGVPGAEVLRDEFLRRFEPEFREAWVSFDPSGNGSVDAKALGDALFSIGHHPTEATLREMVDEARAASGGCERFPEFAAIVGRKLMQQAAAARP